MRARILFTISAMSVGALLFLFVFITTEQPVNAGTYDSTKGCTPDSGAKKLGGRAWNSRMGWITQDFIVNISPTNQPRCSLGLMQQSGTNKPAGEVTGWSWSKFGYICWGDTCNKYGNNNSKKAPNSSSAAPRVEIYKSPSAAECDAQALASAPRDANLRAKLAAECNKNAISKVKGWIKILALDGKSPDNGWVCLSPDTWPSSGASTGCDTQVGGNRAVEYGVLYDPAKNEFKGKAWNATVGWIVFSGSTIAEADAAICDARAGQEIAKDPTRCVGITGDCRASLKALCQADINNFSYNINRKASKWKTSYVGPGIRVTGGNAYSLAGFGVGSENNVSSVDYLIFSPAQKTGWQELCRDASSSLCKQYTKKIKENTGEDQESNTSKLQKRKGLPDSYSSDTNRKEEAKQPPPKRKESGDDPVPPTAVLRSPIGSIDVNKLIKANSAGKNAYGNTVKVFTGQPTDTEITDSILNTNGCVTDTGTGGWKCMLYNNVIVIKDKDFHITKPITFADVSIANNGKGSVTFVIKGGNLKVDNNLYYESPSQVNELGKLASVAWIVVKKDGDTAGTTGNILFSDCAPKSIYDFAVQAAGVFFAENTIYTGTGKDRRGRAANGSIIEGSGSSTASCGFVPDLGPIPFQVNGMMMAKKFVFERLYEGDGSEEINYDGRLMVSVPPGLSDILKKLPTWSP